MRKSWRYRSVLVVAIIGLVLIVAGLVFAYLSNPSRFTINVRDDSRILWRFVAGVLVTSIGLTAFVAAIKQTAVAIAPASRRDINLGIGGGVTFQLCAFTENEPGMMIGWLVAATLLIGWACMRYAQVKGYSKAFAVLGLLSIAGLVVLILLPTRINQSMETDEKATGCDLSQSLKSDTNSRCQSLKEPVWKPSNHRPTCETEWLSTTGLVLSLVSLFGPVFVFTLAMFRIIEVPWDSVLVPLATLFIGLSASIAALNVAEIARARYRTWRSTLGIVASALAIPVTLAAAWLLAMVGLANHPV